MSEVNIHSSLGNRLKELRGDRALNQVEKSTGIPRINLSRYEKGLHLPTEPVLRKIAELYQVPYEDLRMLYYDDYFNRNKAERDIVIRWMKEMVLEK